MRFLARDHLQAVWVSRSPRGVSTAMMGTNRPGPRADEGPPARGRPRRARPRSGYPRPVARCGRRRAGERRGFLLAYAQTATQPLEQLAQPDPIIQLARDAGLKEFTAEVLPENIPMLRVFEKSALKMSTKREAGTVHVALQL